MSTVGESKLARSVQRSVGRAKEKILQNLGKVDRTADELLDEHIGNFNKQQVAATRLQKELNNYIRCIRACGGASRSLLEAVSEVYEPEWGGKELLSVNSQSAELLWNDFAHRLAEQVLIPLNTYQGQFPEMRKKIEKRGRKLVDFDGERHALQALQSNPRRPEAKLGKQREALEAAKRTYEVLNSELHQELPALYNSRIAFLVSGMSTLFASENIFHTEASKVFTELEGIIERLAKESAKGTFNYKPSSNAMLNRMPETPQEESTKKLRMNGASGHSTPTRELEHIAANGNGVADNMAATGTRSNNVAKVDAAATEHASNGKVNGESGGLHQNGEEEEVKEEMREGVAGVNEDEGNEKKLADSSSPAESKDTKRNVCSNEATCDSATNGSLELTDIKATNEITTASTHNVSNVEGGGDVDGGTVMSTAKETNDSNPQLFSGNDDPMVNGSHAPNDDGNDCKTNVTKNEDDKETTGAVSCDDALDTQKIEKGRGNDEDTLNEKVNENGVLGGKAPPRSNVGNATISASSRQVNGQVAGFLYQVRTTYRYQKEDVDELSFDAGEVINVVEYDDPEDQEEGWLMGVKDNGEKGMFPANFTRPI